MPQRLKLRLGWRSYHDYDDSLYFIHVSVSHIVRGS